MSSLASDAVPEVRGGCFVEKEYGVGVTSQHGGWHALGDVVLHNGGHGPCFVRTRCEEQDRLRIEDGSHPGRDRPLEGAPVGDENPRRVGVDEPVEMLLHIYVVARPVIRRKPKVFVEVEEGRVRERETL